MQQFSRRRSAVSGALNDSLSALLVTAPANVRYLTGFTGSNGWLLLARDEAFFLTDPRYREQATAEVADARLVVSPKGLQDALSEALEGRSGTTLGFAPDDLSVAQYAALERIDASWSPAPGIVENERRRKDDDEVESLRRALEVTEAALVEVATALQPGQTEVEVAADLEHACRKRGAESMAFDTIVASGPRSALPHGVASGRTVVAGEPVMIDMGCRLDGYCADITRMIWCGGEPDARWLEVHALVDGARQAAIDAARAGVAASDVDAAARDALDRAGLGAAFSHGTGHGVGLEIHEGPKVSRLSGDELVAGTVVTIEPGVYLEGEFGVRIEDMIRVTDDGCECLTTLSTEPILR